MKKVCLKCYQEAMKYQPPEIGLKPLAIFCEQITVDEGECEVHDWASSEVCCELLSWLDGLEAAIEAKKNCDVEAQCRLYEFMPYVPSKY